MLELNYINIFPNKLSQLIEGECLQDCELIKLDKNSDVRGSFTEVFQNEWNTPLSPVQWSIVKSNKRVLRGMHYHLNHDEYFCLIKGTCLLGLKDLRPSSHTYMQSSLYSLKGDDPSCVIFPKGIVHGWYFEEESIHLQAVSESYSRYKDNDNFACMWNDPELGIQWPFDNAITVFNGKNITPVQDLPKSI